MQECIEHVDARRPGELAQLNHRVFRGQTRARECAHQQGASFAADGTAGCGTRHLLLEREDRRVRVEPQFLDRGCLLQPVQLPAFVERQESRQVDLARQPVVARHDGGDRVEPEEDEVGQVVARQRLVLEVRVHQPKAAQTELAGARAPDVG